MDKQELRNALSTIEDGARATRKKFGSATPEWQLAHLLANFAQIVREEIVK